MKFITCIIVTYYPNKTQLNVLIEKLSKQVDTIEIYDNTPAECDFDINKNNCNLHKLKENLGIAKAQNIGLKKAFKDGAKFVLLMDQDSLPSKSLIQTLINAYDYLIRKNYNVGILGSVYEDKLTKRKHYKNNFYYEVAINSDISISQFLISSGSLIPKNTYELIGGMDEKLFIDYVDFEYCWRAQQNSLQTFLVKKSLIIHSQGEGEKKRFLGLLSVLKDQPIRNYYGARNLILLSKRNYVPKIWIAINLIRLIGKLLLIPFFYDSKLLRLRYIILGIIHGIKNKKNKVLSS